MLPSCFVRCSLFQHNRFVGTIPDSIALLPAVRKIDLENNTLTGAVPAAFWANPSLTSLYAEHWRRPSGTTHSNMGQLHSHPCVHTCSHFRTNLLLRQIPQRQPTDKP